MKKKSKNMRVNGIYCADDCYGLIGDAHCKVARCRVHGGKMEMSDEVKHFVRCRQCLECWPVKEPGGNKP